MIGTSVGKSAVICLNHLSDRRLPTGRSRNPLSQIDAAQEQLI